MFQTPAVVRSYLEDQRDVFKQTVFAFSPWGLVMFGWEGSLTVSKFQNCDIQAPMDS